jgi:hypothetical protein
VNLLTTLVRSLGNERAVTNAEGALAASAQEDWLVQGLAHRLAQHDAIRSGGARPEATTAAA